MPSVIFDLDGTLIDLFEVHLAGFQHVLRAELGVEFDRRYLEANYGRTGEEMITAFLDGKGIKGADARALAIKRREWVKGHLGGCRLLPGAKRLLDGLKAQGTPLALGTSNPPDLGEAILKECGLSGYFTSKAYLTPKTMGKPAPDIFLSAAEGLGTAPGDCAVIEDSVHGVAAAKAAGMKVIAVATGTHTRVELAARKPDLLIGSLEELDPEKISKLFK
jgi:beta-phosphoglucomutase-like phosphatase (HAD superfamily)